MTTDEQKLEVISQAIYEWMSYPDNNGIKSTNDIESVSKDILASLKQFDPEPLETYKDYLNMSKKWCLRWQAQYFDSEQEAIDFCAKHGLRIKK